jgi:hypothetical protein
MCETIIFSRRDLLGIHLSNFIQFHVEIYTIKLAVSIIFCAQTSCLEDTAFVLNENLSVIKITLTTDVVKQYK